MTTEVEVKSHRAFYIGYYILSAVFLLLLYSQNFADPYTGEMWELVYFASKDGELVNKMHEISSFVCFGASRFQPLAFFIPFLLIIIAGTNFVMAHLLSVVLHILCSLLIAYICHKYTKKKKLTLIIYTLTLFTFLSSDVIIWTFFTYIQISCILIIIALHNYIEFLKDKKYSNLIIFYILTILSSLIYEAALSLLFIPIIFYFFSGKNYKNMIPEIVIPILLIIIYLLIAYMSMGLDFKDSSQSIGLQTLVKITSYIIYYFRYSIGISVTPEIHNIGSIYGLNFSINIINSIVIILVIISILLIFVNLIYDRNRIKSFKLKRESLIFITANFLYIFVISYGRVGDDLNFFKPSNLETQFRYYYLTCLLIPLSTGLIASNIIIKHSSILYITLFTIVLGNILNIRDYGKRISLASNALSLDYYKIVNNNLKISSKEILKKMHSNWYLEQIDTNNMYSAFIYNANKCTIHRDLNESANFINSKNNKFLSENFIQDPKSYFSKAKLLEINGYQITSSSQLTGAGAFEAFTGKGIWHVNHIPNPPEEVSALIDFGQSQKKVVGMSSSPRFDEPNQFWKNLKIQGSLDGKTWINIFEVEIFEPPKTEGLFFRFMNENYYRFYRIQIKGGFKEGRFFSLSKINFYTVDD